MKNCQEQVEVPGYHGQMFHVAPNENALFDGFTPQCNNKQMNHVSLGNWRCNNVALLQQCCIAATLLQDFINV